MDTISTSGVTAIKYCSYYIMYVLSYDFMLNDVTLSIVHIFKIISLVSDTFIHEFTYSSTL